MDLGLKGKNAIVTGGAGGIGLGCAKALAAEGCNIIIADLNDELAAKCADDIKNEYGVDAWGMKLNVCDQDSIKEFWENVKENVGVADILVNNVGGRIDRAPLNELSDEAWLKTFDLTIHSGFYMSKAFCNQFVPDKGKGAIINVTSKSAIMSSSKGNSHYSSAKAAVIGMTRILAKDVYDLGIRVNCIAPGYVQTERVYPDGDPRTEEKRKLLLTHDFAKPADLGNVVAFLASEKSYQIIGAVIDVTGGTLC
ncbi:MAG: SDR family oxidoreductase [Erysipelotrichaceae bacterium]|nr:SDR family oxidoreductase [Erysipelotrichaceae bacterium]